MKRKIFVIIIFVIILSSLFIFRGKSESGSVADEYLFEPNLPSETHEPSEKDNNFPEPTTEEIIEEDLLKDTTYIDDEGNTVIKNTDDTLVLVNKNRNLPPDYKPEDLVIPNVRFPFEETLEKKYMRKEAANALEELFNQANEEGIYLFAISGYRSYNTQSYLFNTRAERDGFEEANKLTAYPGQSEHQTGLAMDLSCQSLGFTLEQDFGQTIEGKWLKENAHKFGFIIRYPKEAVDITGYSYEPWHIRYVGKEVAKEIYEKNITLEEYLVDKSSIPVLND
ncbi:M15 family metallopeptidase [Schnuerera sp. xch1]|uniref:M15 family metallopeptidase n=1 Tax=Schnuerera sp. xch1 TaxID=2874283 RepID=UPI001CC10A31|nr:M15 family metallopeptidase [Schnuerera sp. xch1]MBZ2174726.1 M15 family metallopeptidase [Schnuerera sp. xch1]